MSVHVLIRTIATARIAMPTTIIRLAAGRNTLAETEQALCFMAGANAVFTGEQMLTTPCEDHLYATDISFSDENSTFSGSPWDEVRS